MSDDNLYFDSEEEFAAYLQALPAADDLPSFTCPSCHMTSYHPQDIKFSYCGNCHQSAMHFDRQGRPITLMEWADLWADEDYRIVAHEFVTPTPWEVKTIWEGIPVPGCMFSIGVCRGAEWTTMAELRTEAEAVTYHARVCELLRGNAAKRLGELWN